MAASRVVVLGGGIGGVACAHALRKGLSRPHEVVVVDKEADHLYAPSLLPLVFGDRQLRQITRPLASLSRMGIRIRKASVLGIRPHAKQVDTDEGALGFDYLVVALGATLAPERIPGLTETAHFFYEPAGAERLREAIAAFQGGRVIIAVTGVPFKCPAAPYEMAFLLDHHLRSRGLRERSSIEVVTPEPLPMPTAGPAVGQCIVQMLGKRGITFTPSNQLTEVDKEARELRLPEGGSRAFDLLIAIPPHRAPDALAGSDLAGEGGWVRVNKSTLETSVPGVYALGDVTAVKLANGRMLPKAGVFAHAQGDVVAAEIASAIEGREGPRPFDGRGSCFLELGGGKASFARGTFFSEPDPVVRMHRAGIWRHWMKVGLEKWWFRHYF